VSLLQCSDVSFGSKARITAPPGSALQDVIGPDGVNAKVSAIAPIVLRGFVCATVDPTD
jgi:hypothetical protein